MAHGDAIWRTRQGVKVATTINFSSSDDIRELMHKLEDEGSLDGESPSVHYAEGHSGAMDGIINFVEFERSGAATVRWENDGYRDELWSVGDEFYEGSVRSLG